MTRFRRSMSAILAPLAFAWLAGCSDSSSNNSTSGFAGGHTGDAFVYVASNGSDSISAFANDNSGALTPLAGSPFPSPNDVLSMAATRIGNFLYAASYKRNLVSGFSIDAASGVLNPLSCSSIATTGPQPSMIAIAPSDKFLYTVNRGDYNTGQGEGITVFSIDSTGCLTFLQTIASTSLPREAAVERNGHFLYLTVKRGVDAYSISSDGRLTFQDAPAFDNFYDFLAPIAADPAADLLFVVDGNHAVGMVYVLTVDPATGALTQIANSPFGTGGGGAETIAIDSQGAYVFVLNGSGLDPTTEGVLSSLSVDSSGALSPVSSVETGAGILAVDPSGKFAYVGIIQIVNGRSVNIVNAFTVNSGVLKQTGTTNTLPPSSISVVRRP
jgi:6-phosphogluconolactonase